MPTNFRCWLQAAVRAGSPVRPLYPRKPTFERQRPLSCSGGPLYLKTTLVNREPSTHDPKRSLIGEASARRSHDISLRQVAYSNSATQCAIIVGDWQEPSGGSRLNRVGSLGCSSWPAASVKPRPWTAARRPLQDTRKPERTKTRT